MSDVTTTLRNPYLEAFDLYVQLTHPGELAPWREWGARTAWRHADGYAGPGWERHMIDITNAHMARRVLAEHCAWAVPNTAAIEAIRALDMPVIEVGAGLGYWAWLLGQDGVDVDTYDIAPAGNHWCSGDPWTEVAEGDHRVLATADAARALMLCWPCYDKPMAVDCLTAYRGEVVIYVGEGPGGCCASDAFFDLLERDWAVEREVDIPRWPGMRDYLVVYRRVSS